MTEDEKSIKIAAIKKVIEKLDQDIAMEEARKFLTEYLTDIEARLNPRK